MTTCNGGFYACCSSSLTSNDAASPLFPKPLSLIRKQKPFAPQFPSTLPLLSISSPPSRPFLAIAAANSGRSNVDAKKEVEVVEEEEEEVEEELPWIQEKALDLVEFTGSVTQAIPGPRVGQSSLPWILAVPLAYLGVTFAIAVVKTVRKFNSPLEKRRKLVGPPFPLIVSLAI